MPRSDNWTIVGFVCVCVCVRARVSVYWCASVFVKAARIGITDFAAYLCRYRPLGAKTGKYMLLLLLLLFVWLKTWFGH